MQPVPFASGQRAERRDVDASPDQIVTQMSERGMDPADLGMYPLAPKLEGGR
jgi:hypothetical protein